MPAGLLLGEPGALLGGLGPLFAALRALTMLAPDLSPALLEPPHPAALAGARRDEGHGDHDEYSDHDDGDDGPS
jgi:hypothetical protein